jgi:hypothetical protein
MLLGAGLLLATGTVASATTLPAPGSLVVPQQSIVEQTQAPGWWRARRCERLRRLCEDGPRGEGNCRRYRESCGGYARPEPPAYRPPVYRPPVNACANWQRECTRLYGYQTRSFDACMRQPGAIRDCRGGRY